MIRKTRLLPNDIPQSYLSLIVPTFIIEKPNWINHFSVSSVVCRHVESTVWFGWCFKEALPLRFSKCNDTLFYGRTLITNSYWEYSWVREAQRQTSCVSHRYQCYNYDNNHNNNNTLPNDIPQSYHSSIVPTLIIERPNWIHHFSVSSVVSHQVDSTVWFGWCFEEALPLRFFQCNVSLWCGHTLITNSSWE